MDTQLSLFFSYLISAFRAAAEEFELVIEACKSRFLSDFFLKFMDRTRSIDRLDLPAVGADKIVAVLIRKEESEVSGPLMKAKAANNSLATKSLEKPKDGCFVALLRKMTARRNFG